mgnify:CR=1 FL=1
MLFVGYVEGLSAQRAIGWQCADSLSVRAFLGLELGSLSMKVRQSVIEFSVACALTTVSYTHLTLPTNREV